MIELPSAVWEALRCPGCSERLQREATGARCSGCGIRYPFTDRSSLDLRPQAPRDYLLTFDVGEAPLSDESLSFMPLRRVPPQVDFGSLDVPYHLSREMLDRFPTAASPDSLALDLGCGTGIHREVCERAGFQWVGIDYGEIGAPIWADAHALPLADASVEFILTIAVLEHIRYPFVMIREAFRVLKPGGRMLGTVAFLEPFHARSHYHHSHLATLNTLLYGGFQVEEIAPSPGWMVLTAQASMGLFPRMPSVLSRSLVAPIDVLHRAWWRAAGMVTPKANEPMRLRMTAGSFTFVATKPGD